MQLTFCSANYVARAANYALKPFTWGEAERITVERMSPVAFDEICHDVAARPARACCGGRWRAIG